MKTVITTKENVIMAIGTNFSESTTEAGVVWLDGAGYGISGQKVFRDVDVPANVKPNIYKYDGVAFSEYLDEVERIKQEAIDNYTLELIEKGMV